MVQHATPRLASGHRACHLIAWIWLTTGALLLVSAAFFLLLARLLPATPPQLPPTAPAALQALPVLYRLVPLLPGAAATQGVIGGLGVVGAVLLRRHSKTGRWLLEQLTWLTVVATMLATWAAGDWLVEATAALVSALHLPLAVSATTIKTGNLLTGLVTVAPLVWVGWRLRRVDVRAATTS